MASPADPDSAGEVGHCCLCGRRDARCLCRACRLAHTDAADVLAPWVAALKREADRQTQARRERAGRSPLRVRGLHSLDALAEAWEEQTLRADGDMGAIPDEVMTGLAGC